MTHDKAQNADTQNQTAKDEQQTRKFEDLPLAAQRALKEAQSRREKMEAEKAARAKELGGRGGEDPARFGDWEVKGIAIDF